jgi:hypothetical protein
MVAYYKLIEEFSNISIRILVSNEQYSGEVVHDEFEDDFYPIFWSFDVCFQNDFILKWNQLQPIKKEYENWLDNLTMRFNRELNDEIENCQNQFELLNLLTDYKLKFSELKNNYLPIGLWEDGVESITNDRISYLYPENKSIEEKELRKIKSALLWVQVNELTKILETIDSKINLVNSFSGGNKKTMPIKRNIPPLEKLDLYQTSLLFFYLDEVGAIKYNSSREISPIVSQLTGHSEQNLRTEAFSKIIDIKRGLVGRKPLLQQNPSLNIAKVKEIVLEILHKINDDLEKNDSLIK